MTGAEIGSLAMGGLGMVADQIGAGQQYKRQKKLMGLQKDNQMELNQQGHDLAYGMWEKTNYDAQMKQMEKAGLNVGLMYGGGGAGGGTASTGSGGGAVGGSAPQTNMGGMAMQMAGMASQIELNKAMANKATADANATNENNPVVKENLVQTGTSQWLDNMMKKYKIEGNESGEVTVNRNAVYNSTASVNENGLEVKQNEANLFKTVAEKSNLDANALLTNERAKGYWTELLNATKNADSNAIQATAQKLSAEWNTGEFTNWKTWAELGMKAVQSVGSLIKGAKNTTINSTTSRQNYGDTHINN